MKLFNLLLCTFLSASTLLFAQEKEYEAVYFKNVGFENDQVKVEIDDIVALPEEVKFRIAITNKTDKYLIFNSEESSFDIPDQDVRAREKSFMIDPNDTRKKVLRANGVNLNSIREFNFDCQGFYTIEIEKLEDVETFKLPASKNMFTAGPFKVVKDKVKKKTQGTDVKFEVEYTGNNYGFVYPYKVAVKMPDGNTYASANTDTEPLIIESGDDDKLKANWDRMPGGSENDMQLVEMIIQFDGVFAEGTPKKFEGKKLGMNWDEAMTAGKN